MKSPILSTTEHIYAALRTELISCRIGPGERLRTNELAKNFDVSLGAVREALVRLVGDGLATYDRRRGFNAAPISSADLRDLTEATCGIEALCIEDSLSRGDEHWEQQLRVACEAVLTTPLTTSDQPDRLSATFSQAHKRFQDALVAACHNAYLLRMRHLLDAQAERYRQICLPLESPAHDYSASYRDVFEAAMRRDTPRTIALVIERFKTYTERFVVSLEQNSTNTRFWVNQIAI